METQFDVVLGIDMENDIGSFTDFYEGVKFGTFRLLELLERHGAGATFFWTGHAASQHPQIVRQVAAAGHEIGCHSLYHETLGDPLFPLPNNWPVCDFEVAGRIREATRLVQEANGGTRPTSFRCPRLWGSTRVVRELEALGYIADASLPLFFYRNRLAPYHPSAADWTEPGDLQLVEIPNFCDLAMESRDPCQRDRDQWPLFRTAGAEALLAKAAGFVDYVSERHVHPVLCFYFHPWEFHPMPSGAIDYGEASVRPLPFITQNCGEEACRQFDRVLAGLKAAGGRFKTAAEVALDYAAGVK